MNAAPYPYASRELLDDPARYQMTPFIGQKFFQAWSRSRCDSLTLLAQNPGLPGSAPSGPTAARLQEIGLDPEGSEQQADLLALIQNFEAKGRLFQNYNPGFTSKGRQDYAEPSLYLALAQILIDLWIRRRDFICLNAFLKCLDVLCADQNRLRSSEPEQLAALIAREKEIIDKLRAELGVAEAQKAGEPGLPPKSQATPAGIDSSRRDPALTLIGADTARARAYAAILEKVGARPTGIFYGRAGPPRNPNPLAKTIQKGLWRPPLDESVDALFKRLDWPAVRVEAESINSPLVREAIGRARADLLIFAGRGGEIVSGETIAQSPPLFHCHPGRLPDRRGSTVPYYSVLEKRPIEVSAIYLAPEIDAGGLISRGAYAYPDQADDFDVEFDCAIRADLLEKVLLKIRRTGTLPEGQPQQGPGRLYYIAHPILRHLARLSLPEER